jgi:hypothetical protein
MIEITAEALIDHGEDEEIEWEDWPFCVDDILGRDWMGWISGSGRTWDGLGLYRFCLRWRRLSLMIKA